MDNRLTDLSHPAVAAQSRNKTAIAGTCTMNTVLAAAYIAEVLKRRAQSSVVSDFSSALSAALCHIHSCLHKAEGYL